MLIKRDLQDAFRHIRIAPQNLRLPGFCWEGTYWVDCSLPFGLRTAPYIFDLFAKALHWTLLTFWPAHRCLYLQVHQRFHCTGIHTCALAPLRPEIGQRMVTSFPETYNSAINFSSTTFREFAHRCIVPLLQSTELRKFWSRFCNSERLQMVNLEQPEAYPPGRNTQDETVYGDYVLTREVAYAATA
jgi:hypothetical protein